MDKKTLIMILLIANYVLTLLFLWQISNDLVLQVVMIASDVMTMFIVVLLIKRIKVICTLAIFHIFVLSTFDRLLDLNLYTFFRIQLPF